MSVNLGGIFSYRCFHGVRKDSVPISSLPENSLPEKYYTTYVVPEMSLKLCLSVKYMHPVSTFKLMHNIAEG